jgi:hypothetical protein
MTLWADPASHASGRLHAATDARLAILLVLLFLVNQGSTMRTS